MAELKKMTKVYKIPEQIARLVFDKDEDALEVRVRLNVPLGLFLNFQDAIDASRPMDVFALFGKEVLVDWNIVDAQGQPITADAEGIKRIPAQLATRIIQQWQAVVAQASGPLSPPSGNGNTSETQ